MASICCWYRARSARNASTESPPIIAGSDLIIVVVVAGVGIAAIAVEDPCFLRIFLVAAADGGGDTEGRGGDTTAGESPPSNKSAGVSNLG